MGNRSILADPRRGEMNGRVNKIKGREPWRPLAPSILAEKADDYLVKACASPFMTVTFIVRPDKRARIPAVVHVDGTTRAHLVERDDNPRFHDLIRKFDALTGVPALLNTSFNRKGEPIVCAPGDATKSFLTMKLDALAIGNFLVLQ